ncbi:MAG: GntR family transcriptional regulator [Thermoleophilia bacterium]|nr:GntR family transcriptional regulator [Thermoleophilia bacterium]
MPTESTKADEVALILEDEIVSGALEPGIVLRQEQLSERFGVSRTPIREALRRLAALGLVTFVPNRGVRVQALSREELREAFMVRAELEGLATEIAASRITPEDLAALDEAERKFSTLTAELRRRALDNGRQDPGLFGEWMRANHAFHDVIYGVAQVPLIERVAKSARRTFMGQTIWTGRAELDELYAKNELQHRAIREALAAGSVAGARALAREHVLASGRLIEAVLEQVGGAPDASERRLREPA